MQKKPEKETDETASTLQNSGRKILAITAVTFSNGGDNIGVYTPLFASSTHGEIALIISVFLVMTGVWCVMGYYLVNHNFAKEKIQQVGRWVLPFGLIGLGVIILSKSLPLIGL
jgi:cadmium resistance protein CadD (predicted permease)